MRRILRLGSETVEFTTDYEELGELTELRLATTMRHNADRLAQWTAEALGHSLLNTVVGCG
jgi:hypothetical protein